MSAERMVGSGLLSVVLLSLWLGAAIVVAAVVAPAAFAVLPTRTLAGALVGRVLPSIFWSGAVVGRVRADAPAAIEALPRGDARRVEFGRLHGASVALLGGAMLAAGLAVLFTVRALPLLGRERTVHPLL